MTIRISWAVRGPALAAVSALALTGVVVTAPGATALTPVLTCSADDDYTIGDVDDNALPDSVVGLPSSAASRGAVNLTRSGGQARLVTRSSVTGLGTAAPGDRFGAAVALADVDRDGCDDMIVGAPGEPGGGAVHVVFGDPTGIRTSKGLTITPPSGVAGDGFGSALAIAGSTAGWSLWVGAPNRKVGTAARAGAVSQYRLTVAGGAVTATALKTITQDSPGVPDSAEVNDHFGAVIGATSTQVVVGVPDEDRGTKSNAGQITRLTLADDGTVSSAQAYTMATKGVRGAPTKADRFGAAVSVAGSYVAVGIPGEDVGSHKNAGSVQMFRVTGGSLKPTNRITQGGTVAGRAVPGADEAGDRFGSSLSLGVAYLCQEELDLAIGAPGENIGTRKDAGAVTVLAVFAPGTKACPPKGLSQGKGLPGKAEAGDRLGATLANISGRIDFDEDRSDALFIGVPGEDVGKVKDAGVVHGWRSVSFKTVGRAGAPARDQQFGSVLAAQATGTYA